MLSFNNNNHNPNDPTVKQPTFIQGPIICALTATDLNDINIFYNDRPTSVQEGEFGIKYESILYVNIGFYWTSLLW